MAMVLLLSLPLLLLFPATPHADTSFQFHQFSTSSPTISVLGDARIFLTDLALELTNTSSGRATYASPVRLLPPASSHDGTTISFFTTFIFSIETPSSPSPSPPSYGAGLTFHLSSENRTFGNMTSSLGLNPSPPPSQKYFAVEFDTHQDPEVQDPDDNHVGIDINSFVSQHALPAKTGAVPVTLASGNHIQAYVSYNSVERVLDVSISPYVENDYVKPEASLLSVSVDLGGGGVLDEFMYVGFSAATGAGVVRHKIWSWTFQTVTVNGNGQTVASPPDAGTWSGAPSPGGGGGYPGGDSGGASRPPAVVATARLGLGLVVGVLGGLCW